MNDLSVQIHSLQKLGKWFYDLCNNNKLYELDIFSDVIRKQHIYNQWHTEENCIKEINNWSKRLTEESIQHFVDNYSVKIGKSAFSKVAVVPNDTIPFSGLHELVCCIIANKQFICVNNNHQHNLLQHVCNKLIEIEPNLNSQILWELKLPKDAKHYIIHSNALQNNVLKEYFAKRNSLIIEKRVSIGIIDEHLQPSDFENLGDDVFRHFGHSPYNIRKLFVPHNFDIRVFFEAIERYHPIYSHNRYANNYDYHKSILLMDQKPFLDNGFVILRQSTEIFAPIGCVFYEYYQSLDHLIDLLKNNHSSIQHIASNNTTFSAITFGNVFQFQLTDYIDHKDIMLFILQS